DGARVLIASGIGLHDRGLGCANVGKALSHLVLVGASELVGDRAARAATPEGERRGQTDAGRSSGDEDGLARVAPDHAVFTWLWFAVAQSRSTRPSTFVSFTSSERGI